ncbi:hypothetical protein ACFOD1_09665 [Pseudidiomarina halophila]|uniref:Uncharacterized protein n=1 Tax=Pseudidiomarina halophila TaxID=1449799 RepID=A0A432Y126_9GAMM|nr:hypothetical protein [Pseudidiomarina halophila]RUO54645.1 hypothetical protein CWI69_04335 [Pseudidiomarina halophila]
MNRILAIFTSLTLALSSTAVFAQAQEQDSSKTKGADQAVDAKTQARELDKATPKLAESLVRPEVEPDFIDEDSDDDGLAETTVDTAPTPVQATDEAAPIYQQDPGRIKVGEVTLEKQEDIDADAYGDGADSAESTERKRPGRTKYSDITLKKQNTSGDGTEEDTEQAEEKKTEKKKGGNR